MQGTLNRTADPEDFIYDPSLVLYLPLWKLDGSSFADRSAYGHLCTVTGALWNSRGRRFDGSDDYISVANSTVLDFGTGDFSLDMWFSCEDNALTKTVVSKGVDGGNRYNFYIEAAGDGRFYIEDDEADERYKKDGHNYEDDIWTHVVCVRATDFIYIYNNGVVVGAGVDASAVDNVDTSASDLVIGARPAKDSRFFLGDIGEVRVYNRALTPLEIQRNFLATKWRYR